MERDVEQEKGLASEWMERQTWRAEKELNDIAIAIGSNRFLDPPDGGSVSLAEQVTRMRQALEKAEAAQSDAEPVAWQYREPNGEWQMCDAATDIYYRTSKYEMRPLYPAPPRPDASAGLIEAAELVEEYAAECRMSTISTGVLYDFARVLRARAADRSEK